ncbi:MAG: beta-galactosidase [Aristaeellaceae bacterium]
MQRMNLSGLWHVYLDAQKRDEIPQTYPDQMMLPGTTSAAGLGPENPARETGFLTDAHRFEGYAWFMRTFESGDWRALQVQLTLERTRKTTVYLDGVALGSRNSLCTPHRYLLPEMAAGTHTLVIRVDNTDYPTRGGHLTSPDTQSNWNGVTGEISLTVAKAIVRQVQVFPDIAAGRLRLRAEVLGAHTGFASIALPGQMEQLMPIHGNVLEGTLPLTGHEALWDEFEPALHTLAIDVDGDVYETTFGLRKFAADGRKLLCNGREVFLRGKHDGLIFPETGYAPTDAESWRRVLQTAKDYGINHYRFHTCCPPDAAFTAADELGIAMSPELPFWGTVADEGEEGYDAAEREYLLREGFRVLAEFGHHPSFVFFSMGNELWGSKRALNAMLAAYREFDPDKLYISGANNFQWVPEVLREEDVFVGVRLSGERLIRGSYAMCDAPQGIVQTSEPESRAHYDRMIVPQVMADASLSGESGKIAIQYGTGVKWVDAEGAQAFIPEVPVISHEVGQYAFYPDFDEIDRYTGPLKARNFEVFRERLQAAGLWAEHERFFRAAGQLAVDCYRREIETLLRTSELSGFQLLDLQDFTGQGTALVGVLNAFMESKGLISPEEWRQFCASTVVLGLFDRFVLADGEEVRFDVQVSECDPRRVHTAVHCELLEDDMLLAVCDAPVGQANGRLTAPVAVTLGPVHAERVRRLTVRLTLEDGTPNTYPLWVFPQRDAAISREGIRYGNKGVRFVKTVAEAKASDLPAIVIPDSEGKLPATYASDFWCYPMFRSISESMGKPVPIGTLGLCVDAQHPWLSGFVRENHTTPAWYRLLRTAHCENVDCAAPVVQMIDNTERCQRLCLLWLQEGVPHMTFRLWENPEDVTVRAFAAALAEALA